MARPPSQLRTHEMQDAERLTKALKRAQENTKRPKALNRKLCQCLAEAIAILVTEGEKRGAA